jgi:hypothetical protein
MRKQVSSDSLMVLDEPIEGAGNVISKHGWCRKSVNTLFASLNFNSVNFMFMIGYWSVLDSASRQLLPMILSWGATECGICQSRESEKANK